METIEYWKQRALAAEVEKAGAEERCRMMFNAKSYWADRARIAEAILAELRKQKPVGTVSVSMDWNTHRNIATVNMRPDLVVAEMKDGDELFTRPAPAINLNELIPDESELAGRHIEWLNTLQRPMFSDEDWEELTLYTWLAFRDSYRIHRAAMMRKIEEKSK